jgi:thiol:disulfide interchange protein
MPSWKTFWAVCAVMLASLGAVAQFNPFQTAGDPFQPEASILRGAEGRPELRVAFSVPPNHYLYADQLRIQPLDDASLSTRVLPESVEKLDPFLNERVRAFTSDAVFIFDLDKQTSGALRVQLNWQGCTDQICFPPQEKIFELAWDGSARIEDAVSGGQVSPRPDSDADSTGAPNDWAELASHFQIVDRKSGIIEPEPFIEILRASREGRVGAEPGIAGRLRESGAFLQILLILLGGFLLNLTPCVLPLIPINLAVIGAGTRARSRGRGFLLGGAYGVGMAAAYGALGLVVMAGGRFGALNSSPWFNFVIAVVFVVLGLAMLGVFYIDFAKYRLSKPGKPGDKKSGGVPLALFMGAISALLAGACVAPVVLTVLVLASERYAGGNLLGLAFPFLLGAGMGLPWPFAGAGLSFLPKPGRWMNVVKYVFAVFILVMAAYYSWTGAKLLGQRAGEAEAEIVAQTQHERAEKDDWLDSLPLALRRAKEENRPLFIDFWATWCKNCLVMDATTFSDPNVRREMEPFVKLKLQAERFSDPATRDILNYFGVQALPTYVTLLPKSAEEGQP